MVILKRFRTLLIALHLFLGCTAAVKAECQSCGQPPPTVGLSVNFMSMTMNTLTGGTHTTTLTPGSMRAWDTPATWANLETSQNTYDWTQFDNALNIAKNLPGKDMLYNLGESPLWAVDTCTGPYANSVPKRCGQPPRDVDTTDQIWKDYVTAVGNHAKNNAQGVTVHFEIWNEPDLSFYAGTIAQLVTLARDSYTILHAINSNVKVVGPPPSTSNKFGVHTLPAYYAAGGAPYQDVVGLHGYVYDGSVFSNQPEGGASGSIQDGLNQLFQLMAQYNISSKKVWITEVAWGGSPTNATMTDSQKQGYLARMTMFLWMNEIERMYWYAWDNPGWGTLFSGTSLTPAGTTYGIVDGWMTGSTHLPTPCTEAADGTWTCSLTLSNNSAARIMWNLTTKSVSVSSTFTKKRSAADGIISSIAGNAITVGPIPILITP